MVPELLPKYHAKRYSDWQILKCIALDQEGGNECGVRNANKGGLNMMNYAITRGNGQRFSALRQN